MNTIEIPDRNLKFKIPSHLAECNSTQYINFSKLLFRENCGEITYPDLQVHAVYYFLNLEQTKSKTQDDELAKYSNIAQIAALIDDFFHIDTETNQKTIKQYYIHNPIEKVYIEKNYYGPSNEFNNVKWGEYIDGLNHFIDFNDTKEVKYLYLLFATFYREKRAISKSNYTKDKRVKYNPERVEKLAKKFRTLDIGVIYGFYLLFASFQKYLTTAKIYVQGQEIDLAVLFTNDNTTDASKLPGIGMKSISNFIAQSGIFGTKTEVDQTHIWEILIAMYDIKKRDLDSLAKLNTKKPS